MFHLHWFLKFFFNISFLRHLPEDSDKNGRNMYMWLSVHIIQYNIFFFFFFFSSCRPLACYSSASLHLFIGRPRLLFASEIPSCTFLTSRSSASLDMCMLHSVGLLCTHDVMFWIPHVSRILSFLSLSLLVLFIILLSVFISVTSNICMVFAVSVRVSAA